MVWFGLWCVTPLLDAVEDYARRWIKREVDQDPELESLSDWVRTIRSLVQGRFTNSKIVLIVDLSLYLKTKKLLSVFPLFNVIFQDYAGKESLCF